MNKLKRSTAIGFILLLAGIQARGQAEPSVETARLWWPEQFNVWTPLSWPDHYFKFTVLYNGGIILTQKSPHWRPDSHQFAGNDLQLMFCASADGHPWPVPQVEKALLRDLDGGLGVQAWDFDHAAPLLCTEFRTTDGIVLETRQFAHLEGGRAVESALEPEYCRIRIRVKHVDPFYHPKEYKMSVLVSKVFMDHHVFGNLAPDICLMPAMAAGLPALSVEENGSSRLFIQPDGKVKMAVSSGNENELSWEQDPSGTGCLCITFDAKEGMYTDIIVPAMPQERDVFSREESLSFDEALSESDRFWESCRPRTAAVFDVPEVSITEAVKANVDFTSVIAIKDIASKEYTYLSGIWEYDALWPTPGSFVALMMDYMGYGDLVARYDDVFAHDQGQFTAPGPVYRRHSGYLSAPRPVSALDWLSDHGAILWQVANHALLSGDPDFIGKWSERIVRACDFIKDYSLMEHDGIPGLLPAGYASDECIPQQATWNLAWNYRGMYDAVRLLRRIGHPRAGEFEAFLKDYKETFVHAYRKIAEDGPRWTDATGRLRYRPSTTLSNDRPEHTYMTDAFYLDCGPLCLVWAGLMDADDPVMVDLLDFFREGPNWTFRRPVPFSCDPPVLIHEISSCEPCYSFNAFHSWQLGDREKYLEAMYSILVGAVSQNTYISCEHRHGMQGTQFAFPVGFYLARQAVIDDRISEGDLHLLRLCPLAWITKDSPARFLHMPTVFGPVDLTVRLSPDGRTAEVSFSGDWREKPREVVLHVPPVPGLKYISVNGRKYSASKKTVTIRVEDKDVHPVSYLRADRTVDRDKVVAAMQEVMGDLPGDIRDTFDVNYSETWKGEGFVRYTVDFEVAPGERVHAFLFKPGGEGKHPAVLALHSTGSPGKQILDESEGYGDSGFARQLAAEGFVVLAPDYPSFGESSDYDFKADRYDSGSIKGVYNHMSCISLLQTLPYVDKDRIGVFGHSLGGHNAIYVSVFDQRIKAVVSSCGWTLLDWYNAGEAATRAYGGRLGPFAQERYMPRFRTVYNLDSERIPCDFDDMICAIAPRPFFCNAPLHDDNFSVDGVMVAGRRIGKVYADLGVPGNYISVHPDCGHDFPSDVRQQVIRFFRENL